MAKFELKLPQMGESVAEATLTAWLKEVGDTIEMDEAVFEIATDKVDSEVPSEVEGVLLEKLFNIDDVIKVGQTVAVIEMEGGSDSTEGSDTEHKEEITEVLPEEAADLEENVANVQELVGSTAQSVADTTRFYSPLVKNIAREEGITTEELDKIEGTGKEGRVTKNDILAYIKNGKPEIAPVSKPPAG